MMSMSSRHWVPLFFVCLALPASPQETKEVNRRIALDVVVTGKSDKPVTGLQQQDFTVIDNKEPEKLLSFQAVEGAAVDSPVEVVLLVDRVNTSFTNVANVLEQTKKFLRSDDGKLSYPVSLIFFADTGTKMGDASRDGNALAADVDKSDSALRISGRSQGINGAVERFQLSMRTLDSVIAFEAKKPGRKMLIWISPGWSLLSGPRIQLTSKEEDGIFQTIVAESTALREARITLYSIDPLGLADAGGSRINYYREFLKGVRGPHQSQAGNLALQVLAYQSGGRVLNSSNDIAGEIARCMDDANAYYLLSFDSPRADSPNEYHQIDVKIDKPGVKVRTRTGYYAQP